MQQLSVWDTMIRDLVHEHSYDFEMVSKRMAELLKKDENVGKCPYIDARPFSPQVCRAHYALLDLDHEAQVTSGSLKSKASMTGEDSDHFRIGESEISILQRDNLQARLRCIFEDVHNNIRNNVNLRSDDLDSEGDESEEETGAIDIFGFGCSSEPMCETFKPFATHATAYHARFENISSPIDPFEESPRNEFLHGNSQKKEGRVACFFDNNDSSEDSLAELW